MTWDAGWDKKTSRFSRRWVHPAPRDHCPGTWPEPPEWLLGEWPEAQAKPSHSWLSTFPEERRLEELVFVVKLRWRVELDNRRTKEELGLGPTWPGRTRNVACVRGPTSRFKKRLTLPQVRRNMRAILVLWHGFYPTCGRRVPPHAVTSGCTRPKES